MGALGFARYTLAAWAKPKRNKLDEVELLERLAVVGGAEQKFSQ